MVLQLTVALNSTENIYLRIGESSGHKMECRTLPFRDVVQSILFYRRERGGHWEPILIPHGVCRDDVCIYRNTDAGIGRIILRKFNNGHSGIYKCDINDHKGTFIWNVSLIGNIICKYIIKYVLTTGMCLHR